VAAALTVGACATAPVPPPFPARAARCDASAPTYAGDVRPILERRCFACHAGDGPAAEEHDFTRVETLRAQRLALVGEVTARAMPPPSRPPLTDAEADTILGWAACDAHSQQ
jgi:hypothetical protein